MELVHGILEGINKALKKINPNITDKVDFQISKFNDYKETEKVNLKKINVMKRNYFEQIE